MGVASGDKEQLERVTVYFDGHCPMCVAFVGATEKHISGASFVDMHSSPLPPILTKAAIEKEIHITRSDEIVLKNSDAILFILDAVPGWRHVTWFGRLPGVSRLLSVGYLIVAANRHFIFGPMARLFWLKQLTLLGLIIGFALSYNLWVRTGLIPAVPAFSFLPTIPYVYEVIVSFCVVVLILLNSVYTKRVLMVALLALLAVYVLFDQLRLQPWLYQYWWMMFVLAACPWYIVKSSQIKSTVIALQLIIAAIYIYSGLQKLAVPFFLDIFPWMIEPLVAVLPQSLQQLPFYFGLTVPFIEIFIGIGLLIPRYRNLALLGVFGMCTFVLSMLGPWAHNWNSVVWPWNVIIAIMAFILFYKSHSISLLELFSLRNSIVKNLVVLFFFVMPLWSFSGSWDSYPSYSLYSGNVADAYIVVEDGSDIHEELRPFFTQESSGIFKLGLQHLSMTDRNVPMYPEERVYKSIFSDFCKQKKIPVGAQLVTKSKSNLREPSTVTILSCTQVL